MGKPNLGDMVTVRDGETTIAQGVVKGGVIAEDSQFSSVNISTTYGDGFSASREPWIDGVDVAHVEIVESGWAQKWQRRCSGR